MARRDNRPRRLSLTAGSFLLRKLREREREILDNIQALSYDIKARAQSVADYIGEQGSNATPHASVSVMGAHVENMNVMRGQLAELRNTMNMAARNTPKPKKRRRA